MRRQNLVFRRGTDSKPVPLDRQFEQLGKMQRMTVRKLRNLFATAETIRNDWRAQPRSPDIGKYGVLANLDRNVVFVLLKTERSRHATASRCQLMQLGSHTSQQGLLVFG